MQTMNQSLASLYQRRLISLETAMARSADVDELRNLVSQPAAPVRPGASRVAAGGS